MTYVSTAKSEARTPVSADGLRSRPVDAKQFLPRLGYKHRNQSRDELSNVGQLEGWPDPGFGPTAPAFQTSAETRATGVISGGTRYSRVPLTVDEVIRVAADAYSWVQRQLRRDASAYWVLRTAFSIQDL